MQHSPSSPDFSRRHFLKVAGATGLTLAGGSSLTASTHPTPPTAAPRMSRFNMSGYAAPALDRVRIGLIGLGNRGGEAVGRLMRIEGAQITALCDVQPAKVAAALQRLAGTPVAPATYAAGESDWEQVCARDDVDLVYLCTPWAAHVPMALRAMESGKHVAVEVPAALTLEDCWKLVETSERTRRHCTMLENCCYDFFELLTLNLARQGFFGDIVHGEGAYLHDLRELNFSKTYYHDMWRLKENRRQGNLYPTHGLGPICQIMNINRGDRMDYLVSVSSDDFQMAAQANELAARDDFFRPHAGVSYRGNMNTTTIRTARGRTIMLQHDVTSPRPYSRIHLISGTKAMASKWPGPARISDATGHGWLKPEELKKLEEQYTPAIVRQIGDLARQVGGHGGMDFIMDWRLIDCLRHGRPLDQDVYDAALWSAIAPLSAWSVAHRSNSIDVPDFTCGAWQHNAPVGI